MIQSFHKLLDNLHFGDHLCLIYETREQQFAAIVPFFRRGLENNQQCLYIADSNTVAEVRAALAEAGIDVERHIASGKLSIVTKEEAYLKGGYFDPDEMVAGLRSAIETALSSGYEGLYVAGEMTWALSGLPGVERLIEYEAKVHCLFTEGKAMALCQYDCHRFPAETLLGVIRMHPVIIYGDAVSDNPFYIPPDEFSTEQRVPEQVLARVLQQVVERGELLRRVENHTAELEKMVVERTRELAAVNTVSLAVVRSLELAEVLEIALDKAMAVTGLQAACIFLMDEEKGELVMFAYRGFSPAVIDEASRLKIGQAVSGRAAQTGEPVLIEDISADPETTIIAASREGWKSVAAVPLKSKGKVLGVLTGSNLRRSALGQHDLRMLEAIGNAIAPAIENAQLYERMKTLAVTDSLTGLHNVRLIREELDRQLARAKRGGEPLALMIADLDYLKNINDRFGHEVGDRVLQGVAEALKQSVRAFDSVARHGGDEFVIVLPGAKLTDAETAAKRMISMVRVLGIKVGDEGVPVSLSIGIAAYPEHADNPSELFRNADRALYRSKQRGRNRISLYSPSDTETLHKPLP